MTGWLKLWRYLFTKPIWINSSPEQKTVLITIMGMVNYESNQWEWEGKQFDLVPGQVITSIAKIQQRAGRGISQQNVRSSIARFEKLEFLTNQSTNAGRLISIINWEIYQGDDPDVNKVINRWVTSSQQTPNKPPTKQLTPIKEKNKNIKNIKNNELSSLLIHLIVERRPSFKRPNIEKWAEQIDLMIRVDKRDPKEIERVIEWCQTDSFWQNNILSTAKLRKQFDQLALNAGKEPYIASAQILDEVEKDTRTPEEQKAGMEKFRQFASGLKLKRME